MFPSFVTETFHPEFSPSKINEEQNNEQNKTTESLKHLIVPNIKPERHFPKRNDTNVTIYDTGKREDGELQKAIDKQTYKTNSGKVVSSKDSILKSDNVKSASEDKLKSNVSEIKKPEIKENHQVPLRRFPTALAENVSISVHGLSTPTLSQKPSANESTLTHVSEVINNNASFSNLPTSTHQPPAVDSVENSSIVNNHVGSEVEDLNNGTKYLGGCDVDEHKNINKTNCIPKTNSTETKTEIPVTSTIAGQHPDTEIIPKYFNDSGLHLISTDEAKPADKNQQKPHINSIKPDKIIEAPPEKIAESTSFKLTTSEGITIFVVSLTTLSLFGYFGLVVWRKILL